VEFSQRVDALRREGHALADTARVAGVDAPVPSCPDWTVEDLLGHVGRIHRWVTRIVQDRSDERGEHWSQAAPPPASEIVEWFAQGVDPLADDLGAAGPAAKMWSWTADQSSGFWARRMAVETAIHRYDGDLAAALTPAPLERELAVDGIDEFFWMIPFWPWSERVRGNG